MDPYENAMLKFVQTWKPYGGADEQILPEFGMAEVEFYRRVLDMLMRPDTLGLADSERRDLKGFCYLKLRQYGYPKAPSTARPGSSRSIRRP